MGEFISHNVVLEGGTQTAPGRVIVAESGLCRAALRYLEETFGPGPHPDVTVADLGCLEGGYAAEFARAGYDVTGFEARQENYQRATWLAGQLALPNLRFEHGDVRDVLDGRTFDAVFCCGLLYHLDRPVEFLHLLGKVTGRLLILNTHHSLLDGTGHPEHVHHPGEHCDTEPSVHEGRTGHWHHEDDLMWSSFGNRSSFWLRKDELMGVLREAGFTDVAERDDWHDGAPMPHGSGGEFADRGMFTALKP